MKADEAKAIAGDALDTLAAALKAGRSDQLTAYLAAMARFHRYSINNLFLILSQRPDATHVAGFQTWKQFNRFVRKGEKGIVILAPMLLRRKEEEGEGGGDSKPAKPILRFRAVHVFDISQTDGEPLPNTARFAGDPSGHLDRLKQHVIESGITLGQDVPFGADGVSSGGRIGIRVGLAPAEEFAVLVHELAHERLHKGDGRPKSRTVRETEAEAVAFVVSTAIGLEGGSSSSDYISLYDGNAETLAASLERIQRTAAEILVALLGPKEVVMHEQAPALAGAAADCRSNNR